MVAVAGFDSSALFKQISDGLTSTPTKETAIKKVKAVFQFDVKNKEGKVQQWTLDLKNKGTVVTGTGPTKADIIIAVGDQDFVNMASGKLNGQKAFMTGKIKIKGNMMLATKLDSVLKDLAPKK
ncbi:SCP2 sterol-binding domain-containing protein [Globomyces pollinis-pini]|nr:SCP2 sterol-binding domain-containing protein [Globomyces pollinis-pini]